MTNERTSRRIPWVALALSFLSAGVGHLYCGRIAKGLPLYFAWILLPLCLIIAALVPPSAASLALLVLLPVAVVGALYLYAAIDAWRLAHQIGSGYVRRDYNRVAVYWLLIGVQMVYSIGLIVGVRGFIYEPFIVPSGSMSPTILSGDRILVRKRLSVHHFPERGDLVVFRNPTPTGAKVFVKRVVAVAGDKIKISGDRVIVNGKELEKDRVPVESLDQLGQQVKGQVAYELNSAHRYLVTYGDSVAGERKSDDVEAVIPERQVFVLGDNRNRSRDSRHFGTIHWGDIIGYVDYVFWPSESWSRFGAANDRLP